MDNIALEEAIRFAADGDAVLFVGAGVGFLVDGEHGKLPDGYKLSNRILGRADDAKDPPPLDRASGFVIRKQGGVEALYEALRSNLTVTSVDPRLERLYRLPWQRIYTTNYDDAIEKSRKGFNTTNSCTLETSVERATIGTVLHINGSIINVSPAAIERELSLTDRSYAVRNFERSPWYGRFTKDLETARAVIFVGYSLYDLDISRAVFASDIATKTFFFVSPDADDVEKDTLALYGQTTDGGAIELLDAIEPALLEYAPTARRVRFTALREIGVTNDRYLSQPSKILEAQLVYGILPERQMVVADEIKPGMPFLVDRVQVKSCIDALKKGSVPRLCNNW